MDSDEELLEGLYRSFNARDIDGVLAKLTEDVMWANGMDGGYVLGQQAIRAYWTRQWSMVDPHVEPVSFKKAADGSVVVEVIQTIRDLAGQKLNDQTHGLRDKTVGHVFRFRGGRIARFDIQDTP